MSAEPRIVEVEDNIDGQQSLTSSNNLLHYTQLIQTKSVVNMGELKFFRRLHVLLQLPRFRFFVEQPEQPIEPPPVSLSLYASYIEEPKQPSKLCYDFKIEFRWVKFRLMREARLTYA